MFGARCLGISLAVFVLLYLPLSITVSRGWKLVLRLEDQKFAHRKANLLFFLRILPFVAASLFTLAFTLPSFLLLEPRGTDEAVGKIPLVLGLCCLTLLAAGIVRMASAQLKTWRALTSWLRGSELIEHRSRVPVFRTRKNAPSLTVAGVRDPKVLVSEAVVAALTPSELRTALKHEMAHIRYCDNLKKLVFRLTTFPGMRELEGAWSDEAELAADDAAVSNAREALDLASALIKVSKLASIPAPAVLATGLLHSSTALGVRVERLLSWQESRPSAQRWWYLAPLTATVALTVLGYGSTLTRLHALTEWLVR